LLFDKSLYETCRLIEKSYKVEKSFILRSEAKIFTDNKEVSIPVKECKALENLVDSASPVIINDTTNEKVINKEIFRFFSVKPFNVMLLPIIQKK